MTMPTLPAMWTDVLAMVNTFLAWDIVRGFVVTSLGLFLGSLTLRLVGRALH